MVVLKFSLLLFPPTYYMLILGSSQSHVYDGEEVTHTPFPFMRLAQLPFRPLHEVDQVL